MNRFLNYPVKYDIIFEYLKQRKNKTITFFIDIESITSGFFRRESLELEMLDYNESKKIPETLIIELDKYIHNLRKRFEKYEPIFVIFYSIGPSNFHMSIYKQYKQNRQSQKYFGDVVLTDFLFNLRRYYFDRIYEIFNTKYDDCYVFKINNCESDFVPYYIILHNYLETKQNMNLNVILSKDKDLLQCCEFENTIQYIVNFRKIDGLTFLLYNKYNAVSYLYQRNEKSKLTAEYIPLILSIAGDKTDDIPGIKGYGIKRAIKLIEKLGLEPKLSTENKKKIITYFNEETYKIIERNYKLISFEYLIMHNLNVHNYFRILNEVV